MWQARGKPLRYLTLNKYPQEKTGFCQVRQAMGMLLSYLTSSSNLRKTLIWQMWQAKGMPLRYLTFR
jgi:hypothetical protein